jgi:tetratricopeptide (TPR) repeat protein
MTVDEAIGQGMTLHRAGRLDDAEKHYRAVLQQVRHPAALHLLGVVLHQRGQHDQAKDLIVQSLQIEPRDFAAHNNLGEVHKALGDFEAALACARRALELNPQFGPAHTSIAENLMNLGKMGEASEHVTKAINLAPDDPNAHVVRARYLLLTGQLTRGWPEYEWRLKKYPFLRRQLPMPVWTGGKLAGKSILLTAEQGFGDVIQFVRYAEQLAARDVEVYVECHAELKRLMHRAAGVVQAFAVGEPLPRCDGYVPMPSLPLAFNTSIKTIPTQIPYVTPHPKLAEAWADLAKNDKPGFKVGLAWAGRRTHQHDRFRSCPLDILSSLAEVEGVTLYNLQKGADPAAVEAMRMIDRTSRMQDFADTAGLIANLDLVIAVDTAVAHLAGAMGKPVWIMLPFAPEWRWMLEREDSPWYPSAKLFRHESPNDWVGVVKRVADYLRAHATVPSAI